jgi:hypothetical protein
VTVTETVRSALEVDKVESHLHPQGSFDVADHVAPTGREEIWRFTPLKRLRDLHGDAPLTAQSCKASWNDQDGVDIREDDVSMGHEASVSKVSDDQLFYLMSRGMEQDEAMAMIVRGFVEPIAKELPMEYALELNRLIELQMEGAVG